MIGSRNSLSGGMRRWTTEENLSMNELRSGSQTELMDTPLHDSHSNSTGKKRLHSELEMALSFLNSKPRNL